MSFRFAGNRARYRAFGIIINCIRIQDGFALKGTIGIIRENCEFFDHIYNGHVGQRACVLVTEGAYIMRVLEFKHTPPPTTEIERTLLFIFIDLRLTWSVVFFLVKDIIDRSLNTIFRRLYRSPQNSSWNRFLYALQFVYACGWRVCVCYKQFLLAAGRCGRNNGHTNGSNVIII